MLHDEFNRSGDFVDALDPRLAVFHDTIASKGWTPSIHALGGVDVKLHRWLFLTVEGRYLWAAATLRQRFENFDPIRRALGRTV